MALRERGKILLYVAPLSAVLVVVLGVLVGGERPVQSARVYGGPTEGQRELSLRVELGRRDRIAEVPLAGASFTVLALEGGQRLASASARSDQHGNAEVTLQLPRAYDSALELWVQAALPDAPPLARGLVLGRAQLLANAPRRGGFQQGRHAGEVELSVAPAHGVLITGHGAVSDALWVKAERAGSPIPGARVKARFEGAEPAESSARTDERGLALLELRPREPSVRVALEAVAEGIGEGTLAARLPVVQGAIRARREGGKLWLESTGAASTAWVGLFDRERRLGGLRAELVLAPDGRLLAEAPLPAAAAAVSPLWAVVSSQPDLASPSAVGWPLHAPLEPGATTLDVREQLLLDGAPRARAREERRARRIRLVMAGYAAVALLLTLVVFVRRVKQAGADIERHLRREGVDELLGVAPARGGRTVLAAACIGLGFLVLALLAIYKEY